MAEMKTRRTGASVEAFLKRIKNDDTRRDCVAITRLLRQATRSEGYRASCPEYLDRRSAAGVSPEP